MRRRSWVTRGRGAKRRGGQGWANTNQRAECLRRTEVGIVVAVRTSMLPCVLSIVRRWGDGSGACSWQLVASWWLMQEVLHSVRCTAVRFHGRAAGDRHVQSVRAEPASLRPRAARGA